MPRGSFLPVVWKEKFLKNERLNYREIQEHTRVCVHTFGSVLCYTNIRCSIDIYRVPIWIFLLKWKKTELYHRLLPIERLTKLQNHWYNKCKSIKIYMLIGISTCFKKYFEKLIIYREKDQLELMTFYFTEKWIIQIPWSLSPECW